MVNLDTELRKVFDDLENFYNPSGDTTYPIYRNLINPDGFDPGRKKGRFLNKFTRKYVNMFHRVFDGLLDAKNRKDAEVYRNIFDIRKKVYEIHDTTENTNDLKAYIKQHVDEKFYETHKLVDGFKSEVLTEINRNKSLADKEKTETLIVNQEKIDSLKEKKLNIGCGRDIREDYINVDFRQLDGVDVVADVMNLPFEPDSIKEIYAAHIIEHFTEGDLKDIVKYWYSLLQKDGYLTLITPNVEAMARDYAAGKITWANLRMIILGAQDYIGDFHYNTFADFALAEFLQKVLPKSRVEIVASCRVNGECQEMELRVYK
jgi:hypothetical protein